jgi:hypothetical protein
MRRLFGTIGYAIADIFRVIARATIDKPPACRVRSAVRAAGRFLNSLPAQRDAGKKNPDT